MYLRTCSFVQPIERVRIDAFKEWPSARISTEFIDPYGASCAEARTACRVASVVSTLSRCRKDLAERFQGILRLIVER